MSTESLPAVPSLIDRPCREMTEEECTAFMSICTANKEEGGLPDALWAQLCRQPAMSILIGHLEGRVADYDRAVAAFCASLSGRPGRLVLWALTIAEMSNQLGRVVTMDDFSIRFFPNGVPTEQAYDDAWVELKALQSG